MRLLSVLALAVLSLAPLAYVAYADEEPVPPEPEMKKGVWVLKQAEEDRALLLPQRGIGGSEKADIAGEPPEVKPYKITFEGEGGDKLKAYVAAPSIDKSKKYAFVFAFTDGWDTEKELKRITVLSQSRDPLIVCGIQLRVEKKVDNNITMLAYAAEKEVRIAAMAKLLEAMEKDYPIDPHRRFLLADFDSYDALDWAAELWKADEDKFPFRAILVNGAVEGKAEELPPCAYVVSIESDWLAQFKGAEAEKFSPKRVLNELLARGVPVQFHICKSKNFSESKRWQFILRDAIHTLGGPGARTYPESLITVGTPSPSDAVPFEDSNDPYVSGVVSLAKEEQWASAFKKLKDTLADKAIKAKEKKPLQDFQKKWDTYVKNEMERLNKSIEISIKAAMWCNSLHRMRLTAMVEAFKDEKFCAGKPYADNLKKLETYPPAEREKARKEKYEAALKLEMNGDRAGAKAAYKELAKQVSEDGGYSESARAAEYRMSWWSDLE